MTTLTVTVTDKTTVQNFKAHAKAGKVQFHTERSNGTYRKVHFLTAQAREEAEWMKAQREAGRTMKAIAAEIHRSVAAIRRSLNDLSLTEMVEQADAEELEELMQGAYEAADQA